MNDFISRFIGLPVLASKHGGNIDALIIYVHWLMLVLFVGWMGYFVYALYRFHVSRHPKADYHGARSNASTWIEIAVAIVEGVLLFAFSVPLWAKVVDHPPTGKDTIVLKVSAHQFNWTGLYPGTNGVFGAQSAALSSVDNVLGTDPSDVNGKDDFQVEGDFKLPLGRDVMIYVTSRDVIHCFKILPFRVTQDAIPGTIIPIWFQPTRLGTYQINCAQLCGFGHYSMRGTLTVLEEKEYLKWVDERSAAAVKKAAAPKGGGGFD